MAAAGSRSNHKSWEVQANHPPVMKAASSKSGLPLDTQGMPPEVPPTPLKIVAVLVKKQEAP